LVFVPQYTKITKAFVTASDACGRLCKPTCAKKVGNVVNYVPCTGAIKVNTQGPLMYGNQTRKCMQHVGYLYKYKRILKIIIATPCCTSTKMQKKNPHSLFLLHSGHGQVLE
jgi:hypothetical protein